MGETSDDTASGAARHLHPATLSVVSTIVGAVGALGAAYLTGTFDVARADRESRADISLEKLKYANSLIDRALDSEDVKARANALLFYADVGLLAGLNVEQVKHYAEREKVRAENPDTGGASFLPAPLAAGEGSVRLDAPTISKFAPDAPPDVVDALTGIGNYVLAGFGISRTPQRLACFLGQLAHETVGFRHLIEPSSGDAYEGRKDLGNTQPGDGPRFKGRGLIWLTGRANYTRMSEATGIDLVGNPEMAADPNVALLVAAAFWSTRNLNRFADAGDIAQITRRINGGLNGLDDRKRWTAKALAILTEKDG